MNKKLIAAVAVAFVLGAFAGFFLAARQYIRLIKWMNDGATAAAIMNPYAPLKLIQDGHTDRAIALLESSLESGVHSAEINNAFLKTPTNHVEQIERAKTLLEQRKRTKEITEPGVRR